MGIESLLVLLISLFAVLFLTSLCLKFKKKLKLMEERYLPIINLDQEEARLKDECQGIQRKVDLLKSDYAGKRVVFDSLLKEMSIFDESIELAEMGFYKPHFDFNTSEQYKEKIKSVKEQQKSMLSNKTAVNCSQQWTLDGSVSKGRTMANRAIRLTARAFNNECDSAISNTRWNNASRMEARIIKAFDSINKLNESNAVYISRHYLDLKIQELRLTQEYHDKKQSEKEEKAILRQQKKEEERLKKEIEGSIKEEKKYQSILERAQKEAQQSSGQKLADLERKIEQLKIDLEEAHKKSERAMSMAQQTKAGHVYILSNLGSFGADVYKIGMTRRLEPQERVKELGDASVPFGFDVHAMIFCDDAPGLENALHKEFDEYRINLVNNRKEYFKIDLAVIESFVKKEFPEAEFFLEPEAREFRETMSIQKKNTEPGYYQQVFPAQI